MSMMISLDDAVREIDRKKVDVKTQYEKHKSEDDGFWRAGTINAVSAYDAALSCLYRVADWTQNEDIAMQMMLKSALQHFGQRTQLLKTIEEMDELREVINELLWNGFRDEWPIDMDKMIDTRYRLTEEIADVYNMLDELVFMFSIDDVKKMKLRKMARTMERYGLPVLWKEKEGQE